MARMRPFRGLRFNPQLVPQVGAALCPPYDVVSPAEQEACLQRSPYNIVRLELGEGEERHQRAASELAEWQRRGVLLRDRAPAFYLHQHRFRYRDRVQLRRGLVAAVSLEEEAKPHEGTLPQPKADRLALLRATRTQISPIFVLYDDPTGAIARLLSAAEASPPLVEASVAAEEHRLWSITGRGDVAELERLFAPLTLVIADGHHRYESAQAYRQERRAAGERYGAFNFVMMALVEAADPGLLILPVHRLVRGVSRERLASLRERLEVFFELEPVGVALEPIPLEAALAQRGVVLGVLGLEPGKLVRLRLRPGAALPPASSDLDVNILHRLVLEGCLGGSPEISYEPDTARVLGRLWEYQLAFLVNPIPAERVKEIASAGERLPGKSTYFYPKLPTGLVLLPLDGKP